ncbi:Uncharacterised protein [Mycobacteroides abscessus subsp. bolletii]|uniref:hypothetical protein n=1 Tax=Mycobacteroides abscessus TaxID=36809 RepID=UPI0009A6ED0F|nr:hypothetical protein [Mycobacteroides abscessus]SKY97858.1 Uncharacterised protein [Mycobacteroides abscessus subsp. bolletii]
MSDTLKKGLKIVATATNISDTDDPMSADEVHSVAAELVAAWITDGPDFDFVNGYFDGEADAESVAKIHAESLVIAGQRSAAQAALVEVRVHALREASMAEANAEQYAEADNEAKMDAERDVARTCRDIAALIDRLAPEMTHRESTTSATVVRDDPWAKR